ncbi:MAG: iron ABC transporter permease [Phycisphaeraceae bacterium]|nr:iron ABC transporter permease [Phycisphaeraceae bacterium]
MASNASATRSVHRGRTWRRVALVMLCAALLAAAWARLCTGLSWGWPGGSLLDGLWKLFGLSSDEGGSVTLLDIRLTRVVGAATVGAALAASGVALQALLRNPLAEPYILGLSSGAAVGVIAQSLLAVAWGLSFGSNAWGALVGAGVSMAVVYAVGRRRGVIDPLGLLLAGVVLSTINGSLVMLLNYLIGPSGVRENLMYWMMGFLDETQSASTRNVVMLLTFGGVGLLAWLGRSMDVLTLSSAEAMSLGVPVARLRAVLFLMATALAAGAVLLAGPIAFVGLICPHVVRFALGPTHRALVVGSALAGATLIVLSDTASVLLDRALGTGLLPLGIFTAMLGGPVFLWMLRPQMGRGEE